MKNHITGKASIDINVPASVVWEGLTKPELIKQYFFGTEAITDWKVGSPLIFKGEYKGKSYQDKGTILVNEPNKLLRYSYWSSMSGIEDKPENYVHVTYKLNEENHVTTLTIIQENIPTEEMKEHSEENWNKVLDNLKGLLEKLHPKQEQLLTQ
jgi:uncharacterized protein YndB with AHSA1/START domain